MEGTETENGDQVRLGEHVASAPLARGTVFTLDGARLHRELALGNLFVELRQLVKLGIELVRQEMPS